MQSQGLSQILLREVSQNDQASSQELAGLALASEALPELLETHIPQLEEELPQGDIRHFFLRRSPEEPIERLVYGFSGGQYRNDPPLGELSQFPQGCPVRLVGGGHH